MQASEIRKTKKTRTILEQGTIFKLKGLNFQTANGPKTLKDFYPDLNQYGIDYGIVLSQDCDLYRDDKRSLEISHISIALLEPFKNKFEELQTSSLDKLYLRFESGPLQGITFVDQESLDTKIAKDIEKILNNNHSYLYFISLGRVNDKKSKDYYLINISKMVPIKIDHYDSLLANASYQLKSEFANKLGWKIASYFGRVGTPDYSVKDRARIARDLYTSITRLDENGHIPLSTAGFKEAKKIQPNMKEEKILEVIQKLDSDQAFKPSHY